MAVREPLPGIRILEAPPLPAGDGRNTLGSVLLESARRNAAATLLTGTVGHDPVQLTGEQLRAAVLDLAERFTQRGVARGETVCLLRLPRTSELAVAVTYAALTAMGVRVLLPMYTERPSLPEWLAATGADTLIWSAAELREEGTEADRSRLADLQRDLDRCGARTLCLEQDLDVGRLLRRAVPRPDDDLRLAELVASSEPGDECLVLTTSGTDGAPKLVRYQQRAFVQSCVAWESAGLFDPVRHGGRGLCLLFSHSMGVRSFWNALWTGKALCLIPPEWFLERPHRIPSLLAIMRPEHVTGGPGVYWLLLELVRAYPDLKETGLAELRFLVSLGAPYNARLASRVRDSLGLELHNAFGTTETLKILSTGIGGSSPPAALGLPLPGVRLALAPTGDDDGSARLLVQSPFGFCGYVGADAPEWYATGDLVRDGEEGLEYVGRVSDAVEKDAFGVKVSRQHFAARYAHLDPVVRHIESFPLREEPGLGGLVFVETDALPPGVVTARWFLDEVRGFVDARHELLAADLDDFELRHLTLSRLACVNATPPLTPKGTISRGAILAGHERLLDVLLGQMRAGPEIVFVERERLLRPASTRYVRPRLGQALHLLGLDVEYTGGRGDRVEMRKGTETREVVDFVGGFGTTLTGHAHPDVIAAATRFLSSGSIASADQGSQRPREGALARRLSTILAREVGGSWVTRFGSTGADAVDLALTHAFLERSERVRRLCDSQRRSFGSIAPDRVARIVAELEAVRRARPVVLTIEGSYHGTTIGARAVSHLRRGAGTFGALTAGIECVTLPREGAFDLERVLEGFKVGIPTLEWQDGALVERETRLSRVIAAIAEPVLGEGGVAVVSPALLERLAHREFPLILDEIQCGLGRTGSFLASRFVRGACYLFGKALGGGVAKISACAIDRARYVEDFDEQYASTFAGDAFSCAVAMATLDVIERDDVPQRASERGRVLRTELEAVAREFPTVIARISGAGLMLGIQLDPQSKKSSALLRIVEERERLGLVAASYLLHRWNVRVLPSLSAPNTLRVEPSAYVDDAAIDQLTRGLRDFCSAIAAGSLSGVLGVLLDRGTRIDSAEVEERLPPFSSVIEEPAPDAVRVAFLNHFVHPERELAFLDSGFRGWSRPARRALFDRLTELLDLKAGTAFARNLFGGRIWFTSILLPVDSAAMEEIHRSGRRNLAVKRIQEAIDAAHSLGCTVAGLGAYTSIVTDDGARVHVPPGMRICTGNTLTAAVAAQRVLRLARGCSRGTTAGPRLAIVGAGGNIGSALAERLTSDSTPFRSVLLVGRRDDALASQARALQAKTRIDVSWSTSICALRDSDVIVIAAATNEPVIHRRHLRADGPVLVADLSVPSVVGRDARSAPNVRVVPLAGNIRLTDAPDFAMASHIPAGTAFSCAGEAMLLGLAPQETEKLDLRGPIRNANMTLLEDLAERFGMLGSTRPEDVTR